MRTVSTLFIIVLFASCGGCEDTQSVVERRDSGAQTDVLFVRNDTGQVLCKSGKPCECSDGVDNDEDGSSDGFDPECTGPFDDDESSYATGIPGDNRDPKWQDCFFDGNSGAGDDGCRYHTDCLTGVKADDDPDCLVTQECVEFCKPRTPNGCDCLGCCGVKTQDGPTYVVIGSDCSTETISECTSCIPTDQCENQCGRCELCPSQNESDLPTDCFEVDDMGQGGPTCDDGETVCVIDNDCPNNYYCQLGCCLYAPN